MPTESPRNPEMRENLVAYLDGELDEAATQKIEQTLAENSDVRGEVESLARTFEMLDELPRQEVSEEFTAHTLSTIQVSRQSQTDKDDLQPRRVDNRILIAGWVVGLVLSVLLGVLIGGRFSRDDSARLVEEFPVVKDLDIYTEIGSIEYLQKLETDGVLNDNQQTQQP
jgi:anti-sigma factor RsiW